jgi:predicted dehydrogenase
MKEKELRVGLIGFGMIGKIHARAYQTLQSSGIQECIKPKLEIILRSHLKMEESLLEEIGAPSTTDLPDKFFAQKLDLVDICTPNSTHAQLSERAFKAGTHVYCEKPLGRNLAEAKSMTDAAQKAGVLTHTAFIYRYFPAIQQLKYTIKAGEIGRPFHFRLEIFHDGYLDPQRPLSWRLRQSESGGGALADLGIHLIDLLRFVLGDISWVQCDIKTFIPTRPIIGGSEEMGSVDVDDWGVCTLGMANGAVGTLEATRLGAGRRQNLSFEIFGEKGSLAMDLSHPGQASIYRLDKAEWQPCVPYQNGKEKMVAEGYFEHATSLQDFIFAAHLASIEDFLISIQQNKPGPIDFPSALINQAILEAAYQSASAEGVRISL